MQCGIFIEKLRKREEKQYDNKLENKKLESAASITTNSPSLTNQIESCAHIILATRIFDVTPAAIFKLESHEGKK